MKFLAAGQSICIFLCITSNIAAAETQRDLGSHEHGASTVNVVLDGSSVFLEFESPWMNLVGFEHTPSTAEQSAQIDQAMSVLNQPELLYQFNEEADCVANATDVQSSFEEHEEHDEHSAHSDDHEAESHAEVYSEYRFDCNSADKLSTLFVGLSDQWPGIVDIDVQLAGPMGQSALELNAENQTINLSAIK